MEQNSQNTYEISKEDEILHRRLDSLSRLLAHGATCASTAIVGDKLIWSNNKGNAKDSPQEVFNIILNTEPDITEILNFVLDSAQKTINNININKNKNEQKTIETPIINEMQNLKEQYNIANAYIDLIIAKSLYNDTNRYLGISKPHKAPFQITNAQIPNLTHNKNIFQELNKQYKIIEFLRSNETFKEFINDNNTILNDDVKIWNEFIKSTATENKFSNHTKLTKELHEHLKTYYKTITLEEEPMKSIIEINHPDTATPEAQIIHRCYTDILKLIDFTQSNKSFQNAIKNQKFTYEPAVNVIQRENNHTTEIVQNSDNHAVTHAEISIAEYIIENTNKDEKFYIGVSKLFCGDCHYNLQKYQNKLINNILDFSSSHGYVYTNYGITKSFIQQNTQNTHDTIKKHSEKIRNHNSETGQNRLERPRSLSLPKKLTQQLKTPQQKQQQKL